MGVSTASSVKPSRSGKGSDSVEDRHKVRFDNKAEEVSSSQPTQTSDEASTNAEEADDSFERGDRPTASIPFSEPSPTQRDGSRPHVVDHDEHGTVIRLQRTLTPSPTPVQTSTPTEPPTPVQTPTPPPTAEDAANGAEPASTDFTVHLPLVQAGGRRPPRPTDDADLEYLEELTEDLPARRRDQNRELLEFSVSPEGHARVDALDENWFLPGVQGYESMTRAGLEDVVDTMATMARTSEGRTLLNALSDTYVGHGKPELLILGGSPASGGDGGFQTIDGGQVGALILSERAMRDGNIGGGVLIHEMVHAASIEPQYSGRAKDEELGAYFIQHHIEAKVGDDLPQYVGESTHDFNFPPPEWAEERPSTWAFGDTPDTDGYDGVRSILEQAYAEYPQANEFIQWMRGHGFDEELINRFDRIDDF